MSEVGFKGTESRQRSSPERVLKFLALIGSLDQSDNDEIVCLKNVYYEYVLVNVRGLEDTDVYPFEEVTEAEICLEDASGEDKDIIID